MELKPCPFCGGESYVAVWTDNVEDLLIAKAEIRCDCGSSGPEFYGDDRTIRAIQAWNQRASDQWVSVDLLQKKVDILKGALLDISILGTCSPSIQKIVNKAFQEIE